MLAGTCFDMVLSIQSMPGGSCKVCQMALVLIDPIMQHMPSASWYGFMVFDIPNGTCFDVVLSIQSIPGGSFKVCQMTLVLICFDPILQHMSNGSWYGFIDSNFSLCYVALAFSHSPNAKWHLLQHSYIVHILPVNVQILHDKSCVWFGRKRHPHSSLQG